MGSAANSAQACPPFVVPFQFRDRWRPRRPRARVVSASNRLGRVPPDIRQEQHSMAEPTGNPHFKGLKAAHRRAIYKGAGLDDVDIRKPHVGIVNAFTEASPAYIHLRTLADAVKSGAWEAGGVPLEFGTFATCGNISLGTEAIKYELVIRDFLAGSIEIMTKVHQFSGLVL